MNMEMPRFGVERPDVSGAAAELFDLQVAQFRHDEFYHREIARLPVHERLSHMALHFSKYVGHIAEAVAAEDIGRLQLTITDAFIIDLCTANALNLRLSKIIPDVDSAASLDELSGLMSRSARQQIDNRGQWLISAFAIEAGKIARACEKLDHLEGFPYRESISSAAAEILKALMIASHMLNFSLVGAAKERLAEVESRYLFHDAF